MNCGNTTFRNGDRNRMRKNKTKKNIKILPHESEEIMMTDVTYSSNGLQKLLLVSTSDKKDVNRAVKIATKDGKVVGKAKLTVSSMKSSKSEISINVTSHLNITDSRM